MRINSAVELALGCNTLLQVEFKPTLNYVYGDLHIVCRRHSISK